MQNQVFCVVEACNVVGLSCKPGWVLNPQVLMMYVMALQTAGQQRVVFPGCAHVQQCSDLFPFACEGPLP